MKKAVGLGDLLLGLNTPGYLRFIQADKFECAYVGAEANVLASLSYMGVDTQYVTRLPANDIADAAIANLRKYGIGTDYIVRGGDRMSIVFVETGAAQRSSKVVYDRKGSGTCGMEPGMFDWDGIFDDADTLVLTGITPAMSEGAAETVLYAASEAHRRGVRVSFDINYRATMWSMEDCGTFVHKIMPYVDCLVVNEEHARKILGVAAPDGCYDERGLLTDEGCGIVCRGLSEKYGLSTVALTLRLTHSASDTSWGAMMYTGGKCYFGGMYDIHVVGRIGAGDAFAAGLIYSGLKGYDNQKTISFATACGVLKHSIVSDFNLISEAEAMALADKKAAGRVSR